LETVLPKVGDIVYSSNVVVLNRMNIEVGIEICHRHILLVSGLEAADRLFVFLLEE
jgi:hypothetical protein